MAFHYYNRSVSACVCEQLGEKLEQLKKQHSEKLAMKESLRKKSEEMEVKLDRAGKLVTGLAGERVRWEERVVVRAPPTHTHTYPLTCLNLKYYLKYGKEQYLT